MKLHRILVTAVTDALTDIFEAHRHASQVVETVLKSNKKWGARDRAFIAENTYEIVRWWRLLTYIADSEDVWQVFGAWQISKGHALPDWPEFASLVPEAVLARLEAAQSIRKIRESIPDWLDEMGEKELKENWDSELTALNQTAPVVLRVNTMRSPALAFAMVLNQEEIPTQTVEGAPDALVLETKKNLLNTEHYKNGLFEIQDAGSQMIAPLLDAQPGETVVDACAGAGGKTLHLAALMSQKGKIIAMDVEGRKLEELRKRALRNKVKMIETKTIDGADSIKKYHNTADRLLLDVPCSGLGVLRRNPDAKWKLTPEFMEKIHQAQWEIVSEYAKMLKVGGKMVYATCSILPSESEDQVARFLETYGQNWELLSEHRTGPKNGTDGFYMAALLRKS